jgi:thioredoxin-like negative regulator of GroEL
VSDDHGHAPHDHLNSEEGSAAEPEASGEPVTPKGISLSAIVILLVVAVLAGVLFAKAQRGATSARSATVVGATSGAPGKPAAATITSVHNDAVADYETALKTGKPVYVLFHSLSCQPCAEISAVAARVMPAYDGRVVFVNAISDDPSAQQLASKFQFQYIPTSFFITPDGKVADSFTGSMTSVDMKARLDKLIAP